MTSITRFGQTPAPRHAAGPAVKFAQALSANPAAPEAPASETAPSVGTADLTAALKARNNIVHLPTFAGRPVRFGADRQHISQRAGHPVFIAPEFEDQYMAALELERAGKRQTPQMAGVVEEIEGQKMMVDLDTHFFNQGIVSVEGPVTDGMAAMLTRQIRYLVSKRLQEGSNEPILMTINSPGGSMFAMNAITDAMENARRTRVNGEPLKIVATITGMAASAGSIIAATASEVYMTPNAMYMLHAPISGTQGEYHGMVQSMKLTQRLWQKALDIYRKKMGYKQSDLAKWTQIGERWLDPYQAMKVGLCEGIMDSYDHVTPREEALGLSEPFEKGRIDLFEVDPAHKDDLVAEDRDV